jgi:prepilin-type N-terminal cleavage/methylation domain-containing protein
VAGTPVAGTTVKVTAERDNDGGFTLVEMLVALLILGLALAALAPTFYGALRAAASTNYRSVANGLAVAANEQLRSAPYAEVGYSSDIAGCTSSQGWQQVDNLPTGMTNPIPPTSTQTIRPITYNTLRCLYWAPSSGNISSVECPPPSAAVGAFANGQCYQAYKESVVTVSWRVGKLNYSVSQTSAIYPGGEQAYSGPANNFSSSGSTGFTPTPPSQPLSVTATTRLSGSAAVIQVTWQAPASNNTDSYLVEYGAGSTAAAALASPTPVMANTLSASLNVSTNTQYWIEVIGVNSGGQGAASTPVTVTTPVATSQTCSVSNLVVTPLTAKVNNNGIITGNPKSFSLSLTELVPSACTGATITVQYLPQTGSTNYQYAPVTGSGTLTGTAGDSTTAWSTGNHIFTAYINGSPATPAATQQISICQSGC